MGWEEWREGGREQKFCGRLHQPTINDALHAPLVGSQKEVVDEALITWIIEDFQAFNVVESEAFQEFLKTLNPRYQLPTRKTVAKRVKSLSSLPCSA